MTREEIIDFCEMKAELEPENEDIFNYITKALAQETTSRESYEHEYFLRKELDFKVARLEKQIAEQEPILDKIRAEIEHTGAYEQEIYGETEFLKGINYCLSVINKYKAESDEHE
jgi:hypothetical protein